MMRYTLTERSDRDILLQTSCEVFQINVLLLESLDYKGKSEHLRIQAQTKSRLSKLERKIDAHLKTTSKKRGKKQC